MLATRTTNSASKSICKWCLHRSTASCNTLSAASLAASQAVLRSSSQRHFSVRTFGTKGFGTLGGSVLSSSSSTPTVMTDQLPYNMDNLAGSCSLLTSLRQAMASRGIGQGVQAYIIPSEDPHMSEYSPDCFKRREYISQFTGTAGWIVVTQDRALLWTDGRYFLQASQELSKEWTLMKAGMPGVPDMEDWLAMNLPAGSSVGIDASCHTVDSVRRLTRRLQEEDVDVVALPCNLVDMVWGKWRPSDPSNPLRVHDKWAGLSIADKVTQLKEQLKTHKAGVLLVSMLDEVMWLLNVRGSDVSCNPVALSYAIVRVDGPTSLYIDSSKITPPVDQHLKSAGVLVQPYHSFLSDVRAEAAAGKVILLDPSKISCAVYMAAKEGVSMAPSASTLQGNGSKSARKRPRVEDNTDNTTTDTTSEDPRVLLSDAVTPSRGHIVEASSPVVAAKAVKNDTEVAGMREAHLRDAVAISQFFAFIEKEIAAGRTFTEVEIDEELTGRRALQPGFIEPSFPTIAGANGNGAIIHYRAQPGSCKTVGKDTMLLLDSGGQYDCGTTDITRTVHFGTPTAYQKRCFTRVLQGHIALDTTVFPEGTPGVSIDAMARQWLWRDGLNYRHGTGHGVGAALNVHEGPQSISMRFNITTPLTAGMICSNEPGYYEDNAFGIRIENLALIKDVNTPHRFGGVSYFGFSYLTLVPIQAKLIDLSLITDVEVAWLDNYHKDVYAQVAPRLEDQPEVLSWLQRNTLPLREQVA